MKFTRIKTDHGVLTTAQDSNGVQKTVLTPTVDPKSPLAAHVSAMDDALNRGAQMFTRNAQQYQPAALTENNRLVAATVHGAPFIALQGEGRAMKQNISEARARATAVTPATPATAHIRARTLSKWDAADLPTKAAMISTLPTEGLAALHESGAVNELPDDLRDIATNRFMLEQFAASTGLQAGFQKKPTPDDPLAIGPDTDAANVAAQNAMNVFNNQSKTVEDIESYLRNIVGIVAVATGLHPPQAYKLLTTGKADA